MPFRLAMPLIAVMLATCLSVAQDELPVTTAPAPPPTQQGGPPRTPAELLARVETRLERGRELMRVGMREEAELMLKDAQRGLELVMSAGSFNIQADTLAGEIAMELGDENTARAHFSKVIAIEKSNFRANLGLGRYYAVSHLWRQAGVYLETASNVAPPDRRSEVLRLLAICYSGQGKRSEAEATALQAVQADPDNFEAWQFLVRSRVEVEKFASAVEAAESLVAAVANKRAENPSDAAQTQALTRAYETLHQALTRYHNSLYKRNARNEPTEEILAGNEREAARVLARVSAVVESAADLRRELSYHERLTYLTKAVEYQPHHTGLLLERAALLNATHQSAQAIETCQEILAIETPSDDDPQSAAENKTKAREFLVEQGAPLVKPVAENDESADETGEPSEEVGSVQPSD